MIASHGRDGRQVERGIQHHLRSMPGAWAARIVEPPDSIVAEHHHDWPVLTLYVMGEGVLVGDGGKVRVNRPAAALRRAGEAHANVIRATGLEQIDIQFDPAWLKPFGGWALCGRGGVWVGGQLAARASMLRRQWVDPSSSDAELAASTARLLEAAAASRTVKEPAWVQTLLREVEDGRARSTIDLARRLGLHPGWLAQAYRAAVGEGLTETIQRHRIQRAAILLRTTDMPAAEVAAETGFCDQSHMIRSFKRLLGRSPTCIRREREQLSGAVADRG